MQEQIAWRLDPQISYSDWIIEVTRLTSSDDVFFGTKQDIVSRTKKDTYHVHKAFLSCGPRKSSYFYGLFHSNRKQQDTYLLLDKNTTTTTTTTTESSSIYKTTRISLEHSVADVFPLFLDYVYSGTLVLSIESAVALHYLSDYFGVEPLKHEVFEFVRNDMMPKESFRQQRARLLLQQNKPMKEVLVDIKENENEIDSNNNNKENQHEDSDSVILESCMKSATRWNLVRDRLLSPYNNYNNNDRAGLVELMTQMLTLEQKNLLFFYALREQSNGRRRGRHDAMDEWKVQNQQQSLMDAQEMIRVQQEMTGLKEELESLKNQNEAYSHAFVSLKQDNEKLASKNQMLEQQTLEMDGLCEEIASLKKKQEDQEQEQLGLKLKIDQLEQEKTTLKQTMDAQSSKMSVLYSSTERLERKLTKAKFKNRTATAANEDELERLKQGHLAEISRIKGESSKLVYQFQEESAHWREDNGKLKRQCELLEELYWTGGR
ncbi:unnamed protein product [Cylindrotheca closterium]|uniref:BTB domain-containing protein n=1 Tax=Cylindrotheca closterium TaxID=2856 RepID=A0AAD2CK71_9STRA|nr:unnamed protein product [Cylindrotheca closterium]